jgi:sulfate transport system ATP-binding protein
VSIELRHITRSFGRYTVLRDVSLTVAEGELLALLGPSGSGKTTLLRVIAGLEQPDDGSGPILFQDQDIAPRDVSRRRVGFVFQHYALFRHLSVFENVAFGLRVRPRAARPPEPVIRDKVHRLLRLVQLEGFAARYPHQLSGGQRQRVALARALAIEPKVLLLDEPFGSLDAKVRQELRSWLRRLHDEIHVTSVFVTHDQDEALEVADRVVVMNRGRIEQVGTPDEVFHRPETEFVMDFLGNVNRFHGRVEQGKVVFSTVTMEPAVADGLAAGSASVFIRPHDLELHTAENGHPSFNATVIRIHSAGPAVRLELRAESGETLHAQVSQERYRALAIEPGSVVVVAPRAIRVFPDPAARDTQRPLVRAGDKP